MSKLRKMKKIRKNRKLLRKRKNIRKRFKKRNRLKKYKIKENRVNRLLKKRVLLKRLETQMKMN